MPHDIFISYSRKDKEKADQLSELLASAGLSVWIDQKGIVGAEKWATEIVEGIKACSTFILLLSPNSIESENVLRELSLASEKRKRVLPVDIEPTILPSSFEYPLAGLQRVSISEFDKIIYAHKHGVEKVIKKDERKSLMILPFEDLSPTADKGWFADGIVSELISVLSNVKSLRVTDVATTKDFKRYHGTLPNYAKEMSIRYFVTGDVRKFGDQIKISSRLLDIESGDHLWQDSMKGTMDDIFDIQEKVAGKVVEGLKVHLASDEKKKLAERGTENAEAYELFMKANEYHLRQTKQGYQFAIQLISEAIHLDPGYALAYRFKAHVLLGLHRLYDPTPMLLDEAEILCKEALRLKPDLFSVYGPLCQIYLQRGMLVEAEEITKEYVRKDPENYNSHFTLGFFYSNTGQSAKSIAPYEESVRLKPNDLLVGLFNLVINCDSAGEHEKCVQWAAAALPQYERFLKLHPDDETNMSQYASLLQLGGRIEDARAVAIRLTNLNDGYSLYTTTCLFLGLGDLDEALATLGKAVAAGFKHIRHLKAILSDEQGGLGSLAGTPKFEEIMRIVKKFEAEAKVNG